jgi:hypothetical protein
MTEKLKILVYRSVATDIFDINTIDELCRNAMISNGERGITGLLVCHENRFFQWIEGAEEDILFLYGKLKKDPRHHYFHELIYTDGAQRQFNKWGMKAFYSGMNQEKSLGLDDFNYHDFITASDAQVVSKFVTLAHHLSE